MQSPFTFKCIRYRAVTVSSLMIVGIVILMILARGTGEDIAGIVATALLVAIVSGLAAIVLSSFNSVERTTERQRSL